MTSRGSRGSSRGSAHGLNQMIVVDAVFARFLLHLAPFPVHQQRQVLHQSPKLVHHRRQYSHQQMPPFQMVWVVVVKDIVHQIQQQTNTGGLSGQRQRTVMYVSGKYINDFAQLVQPQFCTHVVHQIGLERTGKKKKEHREKEISVHEAVSSAYKYLAVPLKCLLSCCVFCLA